MKIAILGATGSIGKQTLDVVAAHEDMFTVTALTANTDDAALSALAERFCPQYAALSGLSQTDKSFSMPVGFGAEALLAACEAGEPDIVLLAVTGIAALPAFVKCLREGRKVALASKEAMVCGGPLVRQLMDETKTPVLPVDSELSAIFRCLAGSSRSDIAVIWLTASGGPLWGMDADAIARASVATVLAHPNWSMGRKISVDSASMVNKGLEVIETRWLFDVPYDKIKIVIHRESVVHSMVEFADGGVMAQLGVPDMRIPIQYALTYPAQLASPAKRLDPFAAAKLTFAEPDEARFPCMRLCREATRTHAAQIALNAANELAVAAFLEGKLSFGDIYGVLAEALARYGSRPIAALDDIYALDAEIRRDTSL